MFSSPMYEAGHVTFPMFNAERHYMIPFFQEKGLPEHLTHWQKTVDDMLLGIDTDKPIYFMADQSFVKEGETQRRPGVHIDGYWVADISTHGSARHTPIPSHGPAPGRHRGGGRHASGRWSNNWSHADFSEPEALILASNVAGARAYLGEFDGSIGDGGDCSSISLEGLHPIYLKPNKVYIGSVSTLHESIPVDQDAFRTLVRLNVPGFKVH